MPSPDLRGVDPQWCAILDPLHRILSLMGAMDVALPTEVRLYVPLGFPPPREGHEQHGVTVFSVPVVFTTAVSAPILGIALAPLPETSQSLTVESPLLG